MLVGESGVMRALVERIERIAVTDFTVLIEGESGVGKELVARQIHERGPRCGAPFVAVNCAALVESLLEAELFGIEERTATGVRGRRGKFELAHSGTLFLDEVGDLSALAQAKLLRVIQERSVERVGGAGPRPIDTRVIAATNRGLQSMVDAKQFRLDLYYRLAGVEVFVPPLRARREDIPLLVRHFLEVHRGTRALEVSQAVVEALTVYDWPGNVRQLERVVERAVALAVGSEMTLDDLPPSVSQGSSAVLRECDASDDTLRGWSSRYARLVLGRCRGNKRRACEVLDISYHTLQALLAYGSTASVLGQGGVQPRCQS